MPSKGLSSKNNTKGAKHRPSKASTKQWRGSAQQPNLPATHLQIETIDQGSLSLDEVKQLQRTLGNRQVSRLLRSGNGRQPGQAIVKKQAASPTIQRHSESALKAQIDAAALEEEETIQTKPADGQRRPAGVQRHPLAPNVELGHEASFGERKTADMIRIVSDGAFIGRVRNALKSVIVANLDDAEQKTKLEQIENVQWELDKNVSPANPAQVKGGSIKLFYYHPNWYHPDGSVREKFTKSTVLHEGLHFISHNHEGFQKLVPEKLNIHSQSSLSFADTLDEAVTDKIGSELAEQVLGADEAYTTTYWNMEARRGLDFHLTFEGLEMLATGNPQLWLGKMIDIIVAVTGLQWADIKRAYLSDKEQDQQIKIQIDAKRPQIGAAWKEKSEEALKQQLDQHAVAKPEWEAALKEAVQQADEKVGQQAKAAGLDQMALSKDQIKELVDPILQTKFGAPHEIVASADSRSSSADDWKVVRDKLAALGDQVHIKPPGGKRAAAVWGESISETKWGEGSKSPKGFTMGQAEATEKAENPHTKAYKIGEYTTPIPDMLLKQHVHAANSLLGYFLKKHPMGWVIVPHTPKLPQEQWLKAGTPFNEYPPQAVSLMKQHKPGLMNESLSSLSGAPPQSPARTVIQNMGGGGYEANGEFGAINIEHVNLATVVHEMGHHKQNKEQGFSEQHINQIKGVFPMLDLHNILISENKLALRELKKDPQSDPYVRLRYTEPPVRLKISDWVKLAADQQAESENYKRLKARLQVKGGPVYQMLQAIETELADNPQLYPGQVPILFKNYMVDEINQRGAKLLVEKSTDIA